MGKALIGDLRSRVLKASDEGMSARQAAARFGVGVSSAIRWIARAKIGELAPRPQGYRRASSLDAHERSDIARQRPTLQDPRLRRARLRAAEIPHGTVHTHDRNGARQDEDRCGQPRLQPKPLRLAPGANCARMTAKATETATRNANIGEKH